MRTTLRSLLVAGLLAFSSTFAVAQVTEVVTVNPNLAIPDDLYDGTLGSMACTTFDFSGSEIVSITDVQLSTSMNHTWVGDLVAKLVNPSGEVLTVFSRPGFAETADDGSGCCGDSSNMTSAAPLAFYDGAPFDAELMGLPGSGDVCAGDGQCDFFPNPGAGPGTNFAQFDGEAAAGNWQLCVGDGAGGDTGTIVSATLTISGDTGGGGCEQDLTATLDNTNPAPGDVITFDVTVTNNSANPAPLDLWLDATGPVNRTIRLGSGTVPAGATVNRDVRLRIPGNTPSGTYNLALNIGQFPDNVCDTVGFTITVGTAPRVAVTNEVKAEVEDRVGATAQSQPDVTFEVLEGFFAAEATSSAPAVAPNPFARQTQITYEVAASSDVRLAVYDVLGREVAVLVDGHQEAGTQVATFDARGLAAGTYVYRLVVGNDVQTGRLTLAY